MRSEEPVDRRGGPMIRAGRDLGHASATLAHAVAERLGLAPADWECLSLLCENEPMPAGRLAELTGLSTGAVTGLVDRLVAAGYVERRRDREDRRRVFVGLVPGALARIQPLFDPMLAELSELHTRYGDDELTLVVRALEDGSEVVRRHALRIRSATEAAGSVHEAGPAAS